MTILTCRGVSDIKGEGLEYSFLISPSHESDAPNALESQRIPDSFTLQLLMCYVLGLECQCLYLAACILFSIHF